MAAIDSPQEACAWLGSLRHRPRPVRTEDRAAVRAMVDELETHDYGRRAELS